MERFQVGSLLGISFALSNDVAVVVSSAASSASEGSNMYTSLLVPLDRSTFAEQALPLVVSVARRANAQLDLVQMASCEKRRWP